MNALEIRRKTIAGVPVDLVDFRQAVEDCRDFLRGDKGRMVVTPNPEFAIRAARDPRFAENLQAADLAVCDGFGLKLAGLLWGIRVPEVIRGVELAEEVARLCAEEGKDLYLLGGELKGVAEKASKYLVQKFLGLKVGFDPAGQIRRTAVGWEQNPGIVERIRAAAPAALFVALGHGKQEDWMRSHLPLLPSVRLVIGIGGSFNYWAGAVSLPPELVRRLHLEWLWRLITEPRVRTRRVFDAVVRFPLLALKLRLGVK